MAERSLDYQTRITQLYARLATAMRQVEDDYERLLARVEGGRIATVRCVECGRSHGDERWLAFRVCRVDRYEVAFYCAECGEEEFGDA